MAEPPDNRGWRHVEKPQFTGWNHEERMRGLLGKAFVLLYTAFFFVCRVVTLPCLFALAIIIIAIAVAFVVVGVVAIAFIKFVPFILLMFLLGHCCRDYRRDHASRATGAKCT